jgi:hypothetical protein
MGYVTALSACIGCHRPFSYNPHRVPSVAVRGQREPICIDCVIRVNPERVKNGLEPIVPLSGAYEPMAEEDL